MPQKREAREFSPENIRRRYHDHLTVAREWMGHLPEPYGEQFAIATIAEQPDLAKEILRKHHKYLFCMNACDTLGLAMACNWSGKQLEMAGRGLEHYVGLRLIASKSQTLKLRDSHLATYTTLEHNSEAPETNLCG